MIDLTEPRRRNRLLISKIQSIGFVDKGACEGADILIAKHAGKEEPANGTELVRRAAERRLLALAATIQKRDGCELGEALAKASRENSELYRLYRCGAGTVAGHVRKQDRAQRLGGDGSWQSVLHQLAEEHAEVHDIDYTTALEAVAKRCPNLWREYQHEVAGR